MKAVVWVAAVALAVAIGAGPAWGQGEFGKGPKTQGKAAAASKDGGGKRDTVADAFALPSGFRLRGDQQEPYNKLKQQMEPKLRNALAQVESATGLDKDKAARNAMAIRKEIKTKLTEILNKQDPEAVKRAQEAARRAREAQQRQQQQKQQQQKKLQQQRNRR